MTQYNFASLCISTLKSLRHLVSIFPRDIGSVSVVSRARLNHQLDQWVKALPNVEPFYAVKSNPNRIVLDILSSQSLNFDCASLREVYDTKKLIWPNGTRGSSIIYAHPLKSDRDIKIINGMNIETTVVDSIEECDKLERLGWKGSAFLRVAVGDSKSKMPFSIKFGATKEEVSAIAKSSKIPLSGVSFHVGSGCEDPEQYSDAIEYSAGYVFDILRMYGHNPKVIDIGGGFSGESKKFNKCVQVIKKALDKVPRNRKIIAEPGRYFAQPSQDLFVKVIAKKPGSKGWRYVIDESLYGHFSCIPFDHQKPAWFRVINNINENERKISDGILFGRTCDSLDVIATGYMEELEVGDWLYFPLMGAYTSATASEFNGFPKPLELEDRENILPTTEDAYAMTEKFHNTYSMKYSNALPPIL
jgi:ornithine decarboxylase